MGIKKAKMNKGTFMRDSDAIKDKVEELCDVSRSIDYWYDELDKVYNDSNWDSEESNRYDYLSDSIHALKIDIVEALKHAYSYQLYLIELVHKLEDSVEKSDGKSKSPSLSKSYRIKGHDGTFKAIAKSKEYTLMQSVEHGNKAYNVILKGNKVFADRVNGINDTKWQSIIKSKRKVIMSKITMKKSEQSGNIIKHGKISMRKSRFEVGHKYATHTLYATDSGYETGEMTDYGEIYEVISRTDNTVTVRDRDGQTYRKKIKGDYIGHETVYVGYGNDALVSSDEV